MSRELIRLRSATVAAIQNIGTLDGAEVAIDEAIRRLLAERAAVDAMLGACPYHPERPGEAALDGCCCHGCAAQYHGELARLRAAACEVAS